MAAASDFITMYGSDLKQGSFHVISNPLARYLLETDPTVDRVIFDLANPPRDISFHGGINPMHQITAKFVKVTAALFIAAMAGPLSVSAAALSGNLSLS